jgi:hypothetical protein
MQGGAMLHSDSGKGGIHHQWAGRLAYIHQFSQDLPVSFTWVEHPGCRRGEP